MCVCVLFVYSGICILHIVLMCIRLTPGPWWQREFRGDYLYVLSRDNAQLLDFLKSQKYLTKVCVSVI